MASQNILQLMTHLNDFEITINNVICEFATRLSTLIDANFFLILENRDGRKLCGSANLVDEYVKGSLRPFDTDQLGTFESKTSNNFVNLGAVSDVNSSSKVSFDALDLSCEFAEDEMKPPPTPQQPRLKRLKRKSTEAAAASEASKGATKKSRMTYDEFGNIEDDICIVDDDIAEDDMEENLDHAGARHDQLNDGNGVSRARGRSMENVLAMDPLLMMEAFEVDVASLKLPFNKIQVLQSLEDPTAIFQKDSVEFKLASSILYDFGKELAHACPYLSDGIKSKVFFHQNFKNFISIFPCLKADLIQNIRIAKKSAEAHLKNNARAGFNSVFDKKKKDTTYTD